MDATFAFFENLAINSYWAQTTTRGVSGDDTSYRGQLDYGGDRYGLQLEHLLVGDNFNPGVGFVRRDDMQQDIRSVPLQPARRGDSSVVRKWSWIGSAGLRRERRRPAGDARSGR